MVNLKDNVDNKDGTMVGCLITCFKVDGFKSHHPYMAPVKNIISLVDVTNKKNIATKWKDFTVVNFEKFIK